MAQLTNKLLIVIILMMSAISCAKTNESWPHESHSLQYNFKKLKRPLVVAVIDTGFDIQAMDAKFLCKTGHKDFTGTGLQDNHGHGSHVSGLIQQYVTGIILSINSSLEKDRDNLLYTQTPYCQIILKYYDPSEPKGSLDQYLNALEYAIKLKVDIINFSGGGTSKSSREEKLIKKALDAGIIVVVAAGNERSDLNVQPYYPACLDSRLYIVGNLNNSNIIAPSSNFGSKINTWEYGVNRLSLAPNKGLSIMTGTSQATAVKTGKLIHEMLINKTQ